MQLTALDAAAAEPHAAGLAATPHKIILLRREP